MHTAIKYLEIVQLSLSLFRLLPKYSQGTFHNFPAIPPATDSEYRIQWGTPGSLVDGPLYRNASGQGFSVRLLGES
jgi:hypothetical protein